jgi:hypothetical protein
MEPELAQVLQLASFDRLKDGADYAEEGFHLGKQG